MVKTMGDSRTGFVTWEARQEALLEALHAFKPVKIIYGVGIQGLDMVVDESSEFGVSERQHMNSKRNEVASG